MPTPIELPMAGIPMANAHPAYPSIVAISIFSLLFS
jgi:hypothetical protein